MDNPTAAFDHVVTAAVGGARTDEYYAKVYANEQNNVPTETLVIPAPTTTTIYTPQQPQSIQPTPSLPPGAPQQQGESALDYFLRTSATHGGAQTTPSAPTTTQPTPTYTTSVGATPPAAPTPDVSPVSVAGFFLHAAFSAAVVLSVVGIMFVVYVIMRTRQLHHHEHHVKELGGHHGGHGAAHATVVEKSHTTETHDPHGIMPAQPEREEKHTHEHHDMPHVAPATPHTAPPLHHESHQAAHESESVSLFASRLTTIKESVASDDEDEWFTALMDINLLLEDVLTEKKFKGTSVKEMLASEEARTLATRDVGLEAEAHFQKLISGEADVTQEAVQRLVAMYAKVCKELGVV